MIYKLQIKYYLSSLFIILFIIKKGDYVKVAILSPTIAPITSVGGLGDVIQDLSYFFQLNGNEAIVLTCNHYGKFNEIPHTIECSIKIPYHGTDITFNVLDLQHPITKVNIKVFSNEEFNKLDMWESIKYEIFADLVVSYLNKFRDIDCVSGHDWHCGLAIAKCKDKLNLPTTMTIHNEAFKGPIIEYDGNVMSFLELGIHYCDAFNTVSPTHREELMSIDFIRQNSEKKPFYGILNGINFEEFNSSNLIDRMIKLSNYKLDPRNYGYVSNYGYSDGNIEKPKIKYSWVYQKDILKYIDDWNNIDKRGISATDIEVYGNIEGKIEDPLIGFVGRATYQKGFDIIFPAFSELIEEKKNLNLIMLASGEKEIENRMKDFAESYCDNVMALIGYSQPLTSIIYGSSDWTIVPSVWEPCGLTQMESMAYCTPVVGREIGGLKDSIISLNPDPIKEPNFNEATGVLFKHYDKKGLKWGVEHALRWTFYNIKDVCIYVNYTHIKCGSSPYDLNSPLSIIMKNCYNHAFKNLSWQNNGSILKYKGLFGGAIYYNIYGESENNIK